MGAQERKQYIIATEEARTLPATELLTGRGFITGKSGSGKSNTMSVISEELLEGGYDMLVVDTDGEYFGLKEQYELLHVGGDDRCDVKVGPNHARKVAEIALHESVPVILDVSGFVDVDVAKELVEGVVHELFVMENDVRKPFLLVVEEMQEYLPQSGGSDDLSKLLLRVAKRGRKRGLGLCGLSQRPSAVDKDFITQCDWMVWHRLTWENDLNVVEGILGSDIADEIPELDAGEGYLMTDWDETTERLQFRRKKTFDAGATPGLGEYERPDLNAIGEDRIRGLMDDVDGVEVLASGEGGTADAAEPVGLESTTLEPLDVGSPDPAGASESTDFEKTAPDSSADVEAAGEEGAPASGGPPALNVEDELNLVVDRMDRDDLDTDDPGELRRLLQEERKRNEILEDEVRELKGIIENVRAGEGAVADPDDDGDDDENARTNELFEEQQPEGVAGVVVESGLLVTYLAMGVASRMRRAAGAIGSGTARATSTRGNTHRGYPITLDRREDRYRRALQQYLLPGLALAIGAALVLATVWLLFL